jgi:methionyl-tRNA synthetase
VLREVPFGQDGDFSRQAFIGRYNSDLANDLGNLVSRTLTMIERYTDGRIPHRGADDDFEELVTAAAREVDNSLRDFQFHRALQEIWVVIDRANRHIEASAPWVLAKNPDAGPHLGAVLYTLAETLRHIGRLLSPFMPGTARAIFDGLGLADVPDGGPAAWGALTTGQAIHKAPPLFPRLDTESGAARHAARTTMTTSDSTSAPATEQSAQIGIDDFARIDLRVGKILAAERVPKSSKLLKLQVDLGTETRQVLAGIGTKYEPEALIGRLVAVVANLKPAKLMGLESQGMILAAGDKEVASLIGFAESVQPGMKIK